MDLVAKHVRHNASTSRLIAGPDLSAYQRATKSPRLGGAAGHHATAIEMYREMEIGFWLAQAEVERGRLG